MLSTPHFQPVLEQPGGWSETFDRPQPRQQAVPLTRPDCFDEAPFDDTFKIFKARESVAYPDTNDAASSRNYPRDLVSVVNGEHLTLLHAGDLNEALDEDDDLGHLSGPQGHRAFLANPNLTVPQRQGMLRHIASHVKNRKRKMKVVQAAQESKDSRFRYTKDTDPTIFQLRGKPRVKPAVHSAVIPQDDPQTEERKKTAGFTSSQAFSGFGRTKRESFGQALRVSGRRY